MLKQIDAFCNFANVLKIAYKAQALMSEGFEESGIWLVGRLVGQSVCYTVFIFIS
jgi:hypothetical protein